MTATSTTRPRSSSTFQPMSQKLVWTTCLISGSASVGQTHERRGGVRRLQRIADLLSGGAWAERRVDRFENAAVERHEMRHEGHADASSCSISAVCRCENTL